jgi:hypothetical protein
LLNSRAKQRRLRGGKSPRKLPRQVEKEEEKEEKEEVPHQGQRLAPSFLPATRLRGREWRRS